MVFAVLNIGSMARMYGSLRKNFLVFRASLKERLAQLEILYAIVVPLEVEQSLMYDTFEGTLTYDPGFIDYVDFPERHSPVWILGSRFDTKENADADAVRAAYRSIIWVTYRRNFAAIGSTNMTSDTGWGCMLRAGQMMLAQALVRRHLGRGWRWNADTSMYRDSTYQRLLRLFQDKKSATYSIHQISLMGDQKAVGEWFGPNTVAQALKKLVVYDKWSNIRMHVALNNLVVISEIEALFEEDSLIRSPILLVVPYRAGLSEFNPTYATAIKNFFKMDSCVGFLGGRPSHALYFVGVQDDDLVFLDPHTTHNSVDLDVERDDSTYHCQRAQRLNILNIDPSLALCFYIEDRSQLKRWEEESRSHLIDGSGHNIFDICDKPPEYNDLLEDIDSFDDQPSTSRVVRNFDTSDEDFEIL